GGERGPERTRAPGGKPTGAVVGDVEADGARPLPDRVPVGQVLRGTSDAHGGLLHAESLPPGAKRVPRPERAESPDLARPRPPGAARNASARAQAGNSCGAMERGPPPSLARQAFPRRSLVARELTMRGDRREHMAQATLVPPPGRADSTPAVA